MSTTQTWIKYVKYVDFFRPAGHMDFFKYDGHVIVSLKEKKINGFF